LNPTVFILPPRETFTAAAAGAIAMVVQRLASAAPNPLVIGSRHRGARPEAIQPGDPYAAIPYVCVTNILTLVRALRRLAPATIEIHQQPRLALILATLFPTTKILLFLHNDPLTMRGLKTRFGRRLVRARLHRVICVSNYLASRYMANLAGPAPAVLPNPLTLSELPPRASERARKILFAGRMVADKAPDIFIAACAIALPALPGWSASMIGGDRFGPDSPETPYATRILASAAAAGIAFAGPRPHADVLSAMAEAAIVAVPSRWPEPFGLTALEALASGAYLICTDRGGLPEVAGDAASYIDADEIDELAAAIIGAALNPQHRAAKTAAGLTRAQSFDTPIIAAALDKLRQSG
jgi:UDP-glucose:(glucosyl)LPS alpha-1,2-glucosyltransferase